jgi:hypothetical protein
MHDNIQIARAAPHNLEAEQALLGAILVNNEAMIASGREPQNFDPLHGAIIRPPLISDGRYRRTLSPQDPSKVGRRRRYRTPTSPASAANATTINARLRPQLPTTARPPAHRDRRGR